jgi:hypothetical protein
VEDHETPGLYLELRPSTPDAFEPGSVTTLAATPGVTRVSWWANAFPDRTDLPRRIEEGGVLVLAEVGPDFRRPEAPTVGPPAAPSAGTSSVGLHFRRTPRAGQGVLTGQPTIGLLVVLISPRRADDAQALRDWADFVHIRHIAAAAVPGYGMITPYERLDGAEPRFLHLYEFYEGDAEHVFQLMPPLVAARLGPRGSPAFDAWASHPALRIDYVNTFNLLGAMGSAGGMDAAARG